MLFSKPLKDVVIASLTICVGEFPGSTNEEVLDNAATHKAHQLDSPVGLFPSRMVVTMSVPHVFGGRVLPASRPEGPRTKHPTLGHKERLPDKLTHPIAGTGSGRTTHYRNPLKELRGNGVLIDTSCRQGAAIVG